MSNGLAVKDRYAGLLPIARKAYGSKRSSSHTYIQAWKLEGKTRFVIPVELAEAIDLAPGDRVGIIELPNGNFVLARMNGGLALLKSGTSQYHFTVSGIEVSGDLFPAAATIEDGLAIWPKGTFVDVSE